MDHYTRQSGAPPAFLAISLATAARYLATGFLAGFVTGGAVFLRMMGHG